MIYLLSSTIGSVLCGNGFWRKIICCSGSRSYVSYIFTVNLSNLGFQEKIIMDFEDCPLSFYYVPNNPYIVIHFISQKYRKYTTFINFDMIYFLKYSRRKLIFNLKKICARVNHNIRYSSFSTFIHHQKQWSVDNKT